MSRGSTRSVFGSAVLGVTGGGEGRGSEQEDLVGGSGEIGQDVVRPEESGGGRRV